MRLLMVSLASAIAIDGAKGVGKTAPRGGVRTPSWLLDDPAQRQLLATDPALAAVQDGTILLHEWTSRRAARRTGLDPDPRYA